MKLEEIFTFENLYESHKKCRLAKQHKGEVIRFEIDLGKNIVKLQEAIVKKKYKLGEYKKFLIFEPKKRVIEAPIYKDRIIINCFCNHVLLPKLDKKLIYDNVACRKNKGTNFAIERVKKFLRREYLKLGNNDFYYLKCDIKKYFPSIPHQLLFEKLENAGFSEDELWMIKKFIYEQPGNKEYGLPLGNQSSQWFALYYLDRVDRIIKEKLRVKNYIRYMDDMILIHKDKMYLRKCKKEIDDACKELQLSLNEKTQIGKVKNGIDFLGFRIFINNKGKVLLKLRASSKKRMKKHLKTLEKLENKKKVDYEYIFQRKNAFNTHIKDTNESRAFKEKVKP